MGSRDGRVSRLLEQVPDNSSYDKGTIKKGMGSILDEVFWPESCG